MDKRMICSAVRSDGDQTRNVDLSLKDKLTDFFSGMANGNSTIVHRVERMVNEQRDEIEMLSSRIETLNLQLERQKEYYRKREDILKEMYEDELNLLEYAYEASSAHATAAVLGGKESNGLLVKPNFPIAAPSIAVLRSLKPSHPPSGSDLQPASNFCYPVIKDVSRSPDDTDVESSTKSDASTQIEVAKPLNVHKATSPIAAMSNLETEAMQSEMALAFSEKLGNKNVDGNALGKADVRDVACETESVKIMVGKAVQSDLMLVNNADEKTLAAEYATCCEESPLLFAGNVLQRRLDKQLNDDDVFSGVEKMHDKTRRMYEKLHNVLKEFPRADHRHRKAWGLKSGFKTNDTRRKVVTVKSTPNLMTFAASRHTQQAKGTKFPSLQSQFKNCYTDSSISEITDSLSADSHTLSSLKKAYQEPIPKSSKLTSTAQLRQTKSAVVTPTLSTPAESVVPRVSLSNKTIVRNSPRFFKREKFPPRHYHDSTVNSDVSTIHTMTAGHNY